MDIKKTTRKDTKSLDIANIMMTNCPKCWKNDRNLNRLIDIGIADIANNPRATL